MSVPAYCSSAASHQLTTVSGLYASAALGQASAPSAASSASADGDNTPSSEFRPVTGGNEIQSGEWLLVEAYTAMWLLALGLVLLTIFKQRKLDAQVDQLAAELARVRQQQDDQPGGG